MPGCWRRAIRRGLLQLSPRAGARHDAQRPARASRRPCDARWRPGRGIRRDPQRQRAAASIQGSPGAAGGAGREAHRPVFTAATPAARGAAAAASQAPSAFAVDIDQGEQLRQRPDEPERVTWRPAQRDQCDPAPADRYGGVPTTAGLSNRRGSGLARENNAADMEAKAAHGVPRTSSSQPGRRGRPSRRGVDCFGRCSRWLRPRSASRGDRELPRSRSRRRDRKAAPRPPTTEAVDAGLSRCGQGQAGRGRRRWPSLRRTLREVMNSARSGRPGRWSSPGPSCGE